MAAPQYAPAADRDSLEVDWANILHVGNPDSAAQQYVADLRSARSALQPAVDHSASMLILQQLFGSRSRLKEIARMFPRSMVEFFAAFTFADISMAKASPFLGLVTNKLFRGSDIPYWSLQTIEDKIKKACFPEGRKVMDITSKKDGNQKVCSPALYCTCTHLVFLLVLGKKNLKCLK